MVSSINHATPRASVASEIKSQTSGSAKPAAAQAAPSDTVKISSAAQQVVQEAQENSVQTAKEAAGGDAQAKRLLAKEAAQNVSK